jgi:hypothetical protein
MGPCLQARFFVGAGFMTARQICFTSEVGEPPFATFRLSLKDDPLVAQGFYPWV